MVQVTRGILAIFTDFPLDEDDCLNEWYTREHLISRVTIEGFLWGKRYEAIEGSPKYLAVYGTKAPSVLGSEEYLAVGSNPDRVELSYVPKFYNTRRTICTITAQEGTGEGGVTGVLALSPTSGAQEDLRSWIVQYVLPDLVKQQGIISASLWETDRELLAAGSRGFTPTNTVAIDWLLVWEGAREEDLKKARHTVLKELDLLANGACPDMNFGNYRLMVRLEH